MKCILDVHKYMAEWMPTVTLEHKNINQCKCSKWLPFSFEQSVNLWITEQATLLQRWEEIVVHSSSMTAFKNLQSGWPLDWPAAVDPSRREVIIQPSLDTKAIMGQCSILLK